jgi:hypothetical protein
VIDLLDQALYLVLGVEVVHRSAHQIGQDPAGEVVLCRLARKRADVDLLLRQPLLNLAGAPACHAEGDQPALLRALQVHGHAADMPQFRTQVRGDLGHPLFDGRQAPESE